MPAVTALRWMFVVSEQQLTKQIANELMVVIKPCKTTKRHKPWCGSEANQKEHKEHKDHSLEPVKMAEVADIDALIPDDVGGRVLSIQSHVVQGYVGNKSAVFPLQLLGMDVDIINSVHFSNHTGYAHFSGKHLRLTGDDLHDLLDGMEHNNLLKDAHTHLLTGYVGSITLLEAIVRVYQRLRAAQTHPERFMYVCDPVLGDLGKLYVPMELVEVYRSQVVPIADVLTPNQFECELLAEMKLETVTNALEACKKLHACGPRVVVISSFEEAGVEEAAEKSGKPRELLVIGSRVVGDNAESQTFEQYEVRFPWIDSYYTGTGDLFAALLLAWLHRFPNDFKRVLESVISTIQDVLRITLKLGGKNCDLKLIQSRNVIANPVIRIHATALNQ